LATSGAERSRLTVWTDGDAAVGLGHVRRCLALAVALAPAADVRFSLRGSAAVAALVRREGFGCDLVAAHGAAGAPAVVLDSYEVDAARLAAGPDRPAFLAVLDDRGAYPLAADVVVNPSPSAAPPAAPGATRYLLGPRFTLLRPEFARPVERAARAAVERVLVILGGATPAPLMAAVARAARRALPAARLDLVVGPTGATPADVAWALAGLVGATIHAAPERVRALMLEADVAVTGGGSTLFELAATGTPAVAIELADNQRDNIATLGAAGTLVSAGGGDDPALGDRVAARLAELAADGERRSALGRRGRALVDGGGAGRVAAEILARWRAALARGEVRPCA
jgi:spore coat polysaccharide biosynthesis predicted glycosyltransferase SpsG